METIPSVHFLCPFSEFLGQAAVVGHGPLSEGEAFCPGHLLQSGQHGRDVHITAFEEFLQGLACLRDLRMQGKGHPVDIQIMLLPQFFNTPGNEIAPGSDVVRKDLQ